MQNAENETTTATAQSVDHFKAVSRAATGAAVAHWYLGGSWDWVGELRAHSRALSGVFARFLSSLAQVVESGASTAPDALLAFEASGQEGMARKLELLMEKGFSISDGAWQQLLAELAVEHERLDARSVATTLAALGQEEFLTRDEIWAEIEKLKAAQLNGGRTGGKRFKTKMKFAAPPGTKPHQWAVLGLFHKETLIWLAGDPGSGKSTFLTQLAQCVVFKREFLGFHVLIEGPVIFIQAEMGEDGFLKSVEQVAEGNAIDIHTDAPHAHHWICSQELNFANVAETSSLLAECIALKPAMIVVDSFSGVIVGNPNADEVVKPVIDFCLKLRELTKALIFVVDHVPKPSRDLKKRAGEPPSMYSPKGSAIKTAKSDTIIVATGDAETRVTKFIVAKQRYAREGKPFWATIESLTDDGPKQFVLCDEPAKGATAKPGEEPAELLLEKVYAYVRDFPGRSTIAIVKGLGGNKAAILLCLQRLEGSYRVAQRPGKRGAKLWYSTSDLPTCSDLFSPVPGTPLSTCSQPPLQSKGMEQEQVEDGSCSEAGTGQDGEEDPGHSPSGGLKDNPF